jgi:tRNA threonylcarbamoyladenosine biosynthesis protein TsaB
MQFTLENFPMSSAIILALDCSTEYCSVALRVGEATIAKDERAGQRHSELLLPMIDAVLAERNAALTDLDAIAFGAGPGSFTGLRIACGVAQGLAFGVNVPVLPIPTLLALAQGSGEPRVIAILDARMGEVYAAAYERVEGAWRVVVAPCLCKADAVPALSGDSWVGVGSGFAVYGEVLQQRLRGQLGRVDSLSYPHAMHLVELAADRLHQAVAADYALPLYVRDKVAFTERERGVGK